VEREADMDGYEKAKDHYDHLLKVAYYFWVAHAVGLAACLPPLKDIINAPPNLGMFIVIFGVGLLAATLLYGCVLIGRMEVLQAIHSQRPPNRFWSKASYFGSVLGIWTTGTAFVVAILAVIYRFASA
jgi:hypothetical protein